MEGFVMCGHLYLSYQSSQSLRQPRALWRCSVCGRQSHMPLDCCTHPDYHLCQTNGLLYASLRRLGMLMNRMQVHLQAWLTRDQQPRADAVWAKGEEPIAHASLNDRLSDLEVLALDSDSTEESCEEIRDGVRELQLR